jgi:tryptophanase
LKNEKAIDAIKKAAEKTGWRVTEFKSNAVIVEKVVDGETISRTIKVYNRHISGDEEASGSELKELRQAIVEELKEQKKSSSH